MNGQAHHRNKRSQGKELIYQFLNQLDHLIKQRAVLIPRLRYSFWITILSLNGLGFIVKPSNGSVS